MNIKNRLQKFISNFRANFFAIIHYNRAENIRDKSLEEPTLYKKSFSSLYENHPYLLYSGTDLENSISNKGIRLEMQICTPLRKLFHDKNIIPNVYLPWGDNKFSQIDILLIDQYGIYVIESKNYRGRVAGLQNDEQWLHLTDKSINNFQNPIEQNKGHILSIKKHFPNLLDNQIFSIVVFNDLCELDIKTESIVIHRGKLAETIENIRLNHIPSFELTRVSVMSEYFHKFCDPSDEIKQTHKAYVESIKGYHLKR